MKQSLRGPIAVLLSLLPAVAAAQWQFYKASAVSDPVFYVDAGGNSPIRAAALSGNIDDLSITASSATPGYGDFGKALLARAHGDFSGSKKLADTCVENALAAGGGGPAIALVCAEVGASDILLQGDLKEWARATLHAWDRLSGPLRSATGKSNLSTTELGAARSVAKGALGTETTIRWRPTREMLPFLPDTENLVAPGERLFVSVVVNGKTQRWMLDTGVQTSAMSRSDASALGLPVGDIDLRARDPSGRSVSTLGVVDVSELDVAGLEVRHARMIVVQGDVSLLGMDLIGRMGPAMVISSKGVSFATHAPRCESPLIYKLDFTGLQESSGVLIRPSIAGQEQVASLDLGSNSALALRSADPGWRKGATQVKTHITKITGQSTELYFETKVVVSAEGKAADVPLAIFGPDGSSPAWTVGSGILHSFDIVLNHAGHTACLRPFR